MDVLFPAMLIGHLLGDYLFQPLDMAKTKSKPGIEGFLTCAMHAALYSGFVSISLLFIPYLTNGVEHPMLINYNQFTIMILIGVPHFLIDRYSLGEMWLHMINGRTFNKAMSEPAGIRREIALAFYAPVYIVVDNTLHILCMMPVIMFLANY